MAKGDFSDIKSKNSKSLDDIINDAPVDGEKRKDSSKKRDYKSIRMPFSQYEFELLEQAAQADNRSKVDFMRNAWLLRAKELLG